MKKIILIFMSLLLIISLVGCNTNSKQSTQTALNTTVSKTEDKAEVTDMTKTEQNNNPKEEVKPLTVTISTDKVIEVPKKEEPKPTPTQTETKKPETSVTKPTPTPSTPTPSTPVSNLKVAKSSEQLIVITTKNTSSYSAVCNVYEKVNGEWKYVWKNLYAVTGLNGVSYNRHEGDKTSPAGVFTLTQAFGTAQNPGTKVPYRLVQQDDWWAGDSQHPATYNTWQKSPSTGWRESESEHLIEQPLYKYAMVIDFNTERTPYKGSGIFLHIAPYSGRGTLGCIGIKENDLVNVLKWINPSKNPKIIISPEWDLNKF